MEIPPSLICVGTAKRYRTKAIQTSKHCNIICMYTAFTTTDRSPTKSISDRTKAQETGEHNLKGYSHRSKKTGNRGLFFIYILRIKRTLQLPIHSW